MEPAVKKKTGSDPTLEKNRIRPNFDLKMFSSSLKKNQYNIYIIWIYQGLVADPGGVDPDPDPTLEKKTDLDPQP